MVGAIGVKLDTEPTSLLLLLGQIPHQQGIKGMVRTILQDEGLDVLQRGSLTLVRHTGR